MDIVKILFLKFILNMVVLWVILGGLYGVGFGYILLLNIILTGASFIIGDLYVLPNFENWGATIADFFLTLATIWLYGTYVIPQFFPVLSVAALSALIIRAGEFFMHQYGDRLILHQEVRTMDKQDDTIKDRELQTEFGEEIDPQESKDEK